MGAFNGSGVFVRSYSWTNDAANNIDITASRMDTEDTGFASGLSLCVTRDGQGAMAASFLPSADVSYDLGSALLRWSSLFIAGNANIGGNAVITGNASVTGTLTAGATTLSSLTLTGGSTVPPIITKVKASNTTRSSTTTAAADPDLQTALTAGTYAFELWITDSNGATSPGGLKGTIAYSGTFSSNTWGWGMQGSGTGTTNVGMVTIGVAAQQMQSSQGGVANMWITGSIVVTGNGTLSFNWAQNSSNGTASIVSAGSWMRVTKLA